MFLMGLELYIFLIILVTILVLTPIKRCCPAHKEKLQKFQDKYLWNGLAAVFIESTLETGIALTMSYGSFSVGEGYQYTAGRVLTIVIAAFAAIWILFTIVFLFIPCPGNKVSDRLKTNATRLNILYGSLKYEESYYK